MSYLPTGLLVAGNLGLVHALKPAFEDKEMRGVDVLKSLVGLGMLTAGLMQYSGTNSELTTALMNTMFLNGVIAFTEHEKNPQSSTIPTACVVSVALGVTAATIGIFSSL